MDTSAGRRRVHRTIHYSDLETEYSHDVNMYRKSPQNFISLNEFEDLAIERLQLLRTIEEASLKGHRQYSDEWKQCIKQELAKLGLKRYLRLLSGYCSQTDQDIQARRTDHISHFILRLAYCRSEDLRRWFLAREMELFKLRFISQSPQGITKFLQINNLTYTPIPSEVKDKLRNELLTSSPSVSERDFITVEFFKVPFTEVLQLVKNRRVYLEKGYAYIPTSDLVVSIQAQFRAALNSSLSAYNQRLPLLDDDRLNTLLNNLHTIYTGKTHNVDEIKEGVLNPAQLDAYSKHHFPLCMKNLYNVLTTTHHLKHMGRLQLILFLKGVGLSYEDAMEFWRSEFTKNPKIDDNKFEKEYSYTVRHSYGKAGSMTNYTPYSCLKIILSSVGSGEYHGCPFKHWDANILKNKLGELGFGTQNVNSIMEMVNGGHFQIACSKYFDCVHGQAPPNMISHPNQYVSDSLSLGKEKQEKKN